MRAGLLLFVAVLTACGEAPEPAPGPVAAPPGAAPARAAEPAPFEAAFDDAELGRRVTEAAYAGKFDDLAALSLPPRCDRVRVAVRVLHSALLGGDAPRKPPGRDALLAAFDALSRARGGASAQALAPLVAAWRGWSDADFAAETALAKRYAAALDAMKGPRLDGPAIAAALGGAGPAPPKSPAAAEIAFVRAIVLLASRPGDTSVPQDVADAYDHAEHAFAELGWPGGLGSLAELAASRLLAENPKSFRALHLADFAQAAYARSHDELRASLLFLTLSQAAEARGDLRTAEQLADSARQRLLPTGARGPELVAVLRAHGRLAQMLGRQKTAARDLGKAWEEAAWAQADAATRLDIASKLSTTLVLVGRYADAYAVTRDAVRAADDPSAGVAPGDPVRTLLDEIAAQAALDLGRPGESAELYRAAAARRRLAGGPDAVGEERTDLLLAASAVLRSGDADGAVRAVDAVLGGSDVAPPTRAHAASVLREAKRLDDAERELARAEKTGGPAFAAALTEERARLEAARGDVARARELFAKAVNRVAPEGARTPAGWEAARVLLDWARMERGLGRAYEASELAGRAVGELSETGLEVELDRARELYADVQRSRSMFVDADKATAQRLDAGPPGDAARREDALLDQLVIRIELTIENRKDARKNALAVAEAFPEGARRDIASQAVRAAGGESVAVAEAPADLGPRWHLLRDVAAGAGDAAELAARCGADEPELRRWAATRLLGGADPVRAIDLRRRADVADPAREPLALADDEALLLIEPAAGVTTLVLVRKAGVVSNRRQPGDAGLGDLWDATWVEPSAERLAAAAARTSAAIFGGGAAADLAGATRLYVSVPEPLGPLPYDLLPYGEGTLLDAFEVATVNSATELVRARNRPAPPLLSRLTSPYASLDARYAVVEVGDADAASRPRLFELLGKSQNRGARAGAALREAKRALRDAPEPSANAAEVPAWARFLIRGADQ